MSGRRTRKDSPSRVLRARLASRAGDHRRAGQAVPRGRRGEGLTVDPRHQVKGRGHSGLVRQGPPKSMVAALGAVAEPESDTKSERALLGLDRVR